MYYPSWVDDNAIVITPMVNSPEKVCQLRPISLCNVVYEVIGKWWEFV